MKEKESSTSIFFLRIFTGTASVKHDDEDNSMNKNKTNTIDKKNSNEKANIKNDRPSTSVFGEILHEILFIYLENYNEQIASDEKVIITVTKVKQRNVI